MNANPVTTVAAAALAAASLSLAAGAAPAQDGEALLRRVDDIRAPGSDFRFTVHVKAGDEEQVLSVSVKDRVKSLVRYVEPAKTRGRAILFVGQNMWIHVPGTRRPLRVTPRQRLLGGVSSADVARTVYSEDYEVAEARRAGDGQALRLAPKGKGASYARIDLAVDGRGAPQRAEFFAGGGRRIKTMAFGGYRQVLGESRPTRLEVIDHLDGDARTVMTYSGFERTETPEAWYQPGHLGRL